VRSVSVRDALYSRKGSIPRYLSSWGRGSCNASSHHGEPGSQGRLGYRHVPSLTLDHNARESMIKISPPYVTSGSVAFNVLHKLDKVRVLEVQTDSGTRGTTDTVNDKMPAREVSY
jgi:hypothetical protein